MLHVEEGSLVPSRSIPRAAGLCRGPDQFQGLSYLPSSRPSSQQIHPSNSSSNLRQASLSQMIRMPQENAPYLGGDLGVVGTPAVGHPYNMWPQYQLSLQ